MQGIAPPNKTHSGRRDINGLTVLDWTEAPWHLKLNTTQFGCQRVNMCQLPRGSRNKGDK